jgi:hypothetical protein
MAVGSAMPGVEVVGVCNSTRASGERTAAEFGTMVRNL